MWACHPLAVSPHPPYSPVSPHIFTECRSLAGSGLAHSRPVPHSGGTGQAWGAIRCTAACIPTGQAHPPCVRSHLTPTALACIMCPRGLNPASPQPSSVSVNSNGRAPALGWLSVGKVEGPRVAPDTFFACPLLSLGLTTRSAPPTQAPLTPGDTLGLRYGLMGTQWRCHGALFSPPEGSVLVCELGMSSSLPTLVSLPGSCSWPVRSHLPVGIWVIHCEAKLSRSSNGGLHCSGTPLTDAYGVTTLAAAQMILSVISSYFKIGA